jgi:uncharacterized membrane protein YebE (DUF533 family)
MSRKSRSNKKLKNLKKNKTIKRGGDMMNQAKKSVFNTTKFNTNTLGALTAKLNALLISNKVPYKFSDGTFASDYTLSMENYASDEYGNEGRGKIRNKVQPPTAVGNAEEAAARKNPTGFSWATSMFKGQ